MFESDKGFVEVAWHVDVCLSIGIIPLNGMCDVFCCFFVHCHWIIIPDCVDKVVCVCSVDIFDGEIINHEAEADWSGLVLPKSMDDFALVVSVFC